MVSLNSNLIAADHHVTIFQGHEGSDNFNASEFDLNSWDHHNNVVIVFTGYPSKITTCTNILRERSLFITDIGVTEDPARTYKSMMKMQQYPKTAAVIRLDAGLSGR